MSQKKMEAYKEAKKNKRQIEKKQKRDRILAWIFGILIAAALIAGSVYLVYYSSVILPKKQEAATQAELNTETEGEVLDGTANDSIMVTPENTEESTEESTEAEASTDDTSEAEAATDEAAAE